MAYQQPRLPPSKDDYAFNVRQLIKESSNIQDGELKLRLALSYKPFFKSFLVGTNYYIFEKKVLSLPNSAFSKAIALLEKQADLARDAGVYGDENQHAVIDREEYESDTLEPEQSD